MANGTEFDWLTVDDSERVAWSGEPRITAVLAPTAVALAVVVAVTLYRPLYGLAAAPLGAVVVAWSYLRVRNTDYVVTDQAVYRKEGVLGKQVTRVELSRIQNTDLKQGVLGTQFGFGDVNVDTAGGAGIELSITKVDDPATVRELLIEGSKRAAGSGGVAELGGADAESVQRALREARALRKTAESLAATFGGERR